MILFIHQSYWMQTDQMISMVLAYVICIIQRTHIHLPHLVQTSLPVGSLSGLPRHSHTPPVCLQHPIPHSPQLQHTEGPGLVGESSLQSLASPFTVQRNILHGTGVQMEEVNEIMWDEQRGKENKRAMKEISSAREGVAQETPDRWEQGLWEVPWGAEEWCGYLC